MQNRTRFLAALASSLALAACSSSSSSGPDISAPTVATIMQNRAADPTGSSVDILFSEVVQQAEAEALVNYLSSAGNITSATLQPDGRTVRLVLDIVAVPGDVTFDIAAGSNALGNVDFSGQVTDGDTVTISDGTTALTFEFNTMGAAAMGNIEVDKGANVGEAVANLIDAINGGSFEISAAAGAGDSINLANNNLGIAGNVAIMKTEAGAVITAIGLGGGSGIADANGNVIEVALSNLALTSNDLVAPTVTTLEGFTVAGIDNDEIRVVFDDVMIESEVEDVANWTVEAPLGNAFDLTNAFVNFDATTRTATVALANAVAGEAANGNGNNLQTRDTIRVTFSGMRDLSGNMIAATAFDGVSVGDTTPPTVTSVWHTGAQNTVTAEFSEPVRSFAFAELYSGGMDPGPRLLLTDADAVAALQATGTITINSDPADGDTVTLEDENAVYVFEWESGGGVGGGNISVAVTGGNTTTSAANLHAAINANAMFLTSMINGGSPTQLDISHDPFGVSGNRTILVTGAAVAVTGLSGGANSMPDQPAPAAGGFAFAANGTSVTMDFSPRTPDPATDSIDLYGLRDLAGNQAFGIDAFDVEARSLTEPQIFGGGTTVTINEGERNDEIVVTFADPIAAEFAEEPSNYAVSGIDLSDAKFSFDGVDTTTITLGDANLDDGTLYTVEIVDNAVSRLRSAFGIELSGNDFVLIGAGGDNTGIGTATAFVGADANTAIVVFPEAVAPMAASLVTNYEINTVNPTAALALTPRAFLLTFATQPTTAQTLDITNAAGTDLAGNAPTAALNIALTTTDSTAPSATITATTVSGVGGDIIFVDFDEEMDLVSALDVANYTAQENSVAFSLAGSNLRYDSATQGVFIELPDGSDLTSGATFGLFVSGLADLSGNPLSGGLTSVTVGGDVTPPDFATLSSAFVNYIVDPTGQTIDVHFDEAVCEGYAETASNWSTNGATAILTAVVVAPHVVRLTTSAQIASSETVQIDDLPDLALVAAAGALAVDPLE